MHIIKIMKKRIAADKGERIFNPNIKSLRKIVTFPYVCIHRKVQVDKHLASCITAQ